MKLAAVVLMLLGAALCAEAKKMPKVQTQAQTDASVLAPAAFKQPNRIYIENGRIAKAVADTQSIQLDPDKSTGSLYFIPLTKEQSSIFIISESGETHAVTISPKERLIAQTIALKDTKLPNPRSQLSSNDQSALPYEERVQRILRAIPSLSHEHAEVLKGTITDGYLIGNPIAAWRLLGLRLERYHLMNQTKETLQIREADFYRRGVVAVATEATSLKPKASADLWIIREDAP